MKTYIKTVVKTTAVLALVLTIVVTPVATALATTPLESQFDFATDLSLDDVHEEIEESGETVETSHSAYVECELELDRDRIIAGEGVTLSWNAEGYTHIEINGETVASGSGEMEYYGLHKDTTYKLTATNDDGMHCQREVEVTCDQPSFARCEDYGYDFEIAKFEWNGSSYHKESFKSGYEVSVSGDATTANWTAGPAIAGVMTKAATVVAEFAGGASGMIAKSAIGTGQHDISNIVFCGNEEPEQTIECTPDSQYYDPEGDLSGFIFDGHSGTVTNSSDYCSYDVGLASYEKFDEVIDNQNLFDSDLGTVEPNSELTLTVDVPACAYQIDLFYGQLLTSLNDQRYGERLLDARHLQSDLGYCGYTPVAPECPLAPAEGRTIVNFADLKLRSDKGIDQAQTAVQSLNVAAGSYDITLVSWDGYAERVNTTQPHEQWQLEFLSGDSVFASSGIIGDLQDNVLEALNTEQVNTDFVLTGDATGVRAVHPYYPDTSSANSLYPICAAIDEKPADPAPSCDTFTASPATIMAGDSVMLSWETSNATQVSLNNGIGVVDADGSVTVTPLADLTYTLTVKGANDQQTSCEVPVTVSEDSVPVCEAFTVTPSSLPVGGGDVLLDWTVLGATEVSIDPIVGTVGLAGSETVNVTEATTFTLTATDADGDTVTCPAPVTVADPAPLTCADNVSFSASDTSITRGESLTLTWSTTDVDSVSISNINATALSGNQSVSPSDDITYTLTATKDGESVTCPLSVDVSSGGGGGGSSSPRCELDISDTKIELGEEITVTWDTSRATEVTLSDNHGKIYFSTDDFLSDEKEDYYDGSIRLKPTRDTKYFLLAERGSRDDECEVAVDVKDTIVVMQTRTQEPLVAGISLSQVPYTGFEAGPIMTVMFYLLLVAWSLYITYLIVIRKRTVTPGVSTVSFGPSAAEVAMKKAEELRPDAFATAATVEAPKSTAPINLPVGTPVVGYENHVEEEVEENPHQVNDKVATALENRAHEQKALLSSDAVRFFVSVTTTEAERNEGLDAVIAEAKETYPLEDGWIVINEARMKNLCAVCLDNNETVFSPVSFTPATVPEGTGSLAEAIVTGNVVAAYQMIGNRPMFALADAAADLDALYRSRRGGTTAVSDLLVKETRDLSDEKIKAMIAALTGALDGTYTDEASAVKMAIMKAVKEIA